MVMAGNTSRTGVAETERCEPGLCVVRPWTEILASWQARRGVLPTSEPRLPPPYPRAASLRLTTTLVVAAAFLGLAALAAFSQPQAAATPTPIVVPPPSSAPAPAVAPPVEAPAPSVTPAPAAIIPRSFG
jgi:hypothetical protein